MKFLQAVDALQSKDRRVLGIFQAKNPSNVIVWDAEQHLFRTFYTHKPQIIAREQLFANDWDIVLYPPYDGFTQTPEEVEE